MLLFEFAGSRCDDETQLVEPQTDSACKHAAEVTSCEVRVMMYPELFLSAVSFDAK